MEGTQGHTWGVHISNPLLLLLQLIDFNETLMEIFFTQCGGPPSIFFNWIFWGFSQYEVDFDWKLGILIGSQYF